MAQLNFYLIGLPMLATVLCFSSGEIKGFTFLGSVVRDFDENNYYASAFPGIWGSVVQDCKEIFGESAHLVSIESEEESNQINTWLQDRGSGGAIFWTSGQYAMGEDSWVWAGNEQANFSNFINWDVNEPTLEIGVSRIALNHLNQFNGKWISLPDTQLERFICEFNTTNPQLPSTTSGPIEDDPIPCNITTDIILVLDSSGSIGEENFQLVKEFSSSLLLAFHEKPESRIGLVVYSEGVVRVLDLSADEDGMSAEEIHEIIITAVYQGGPTPTDLGILEAVHIFNETQRGERQVLLVITDGVSNDPEKTAEAAVVASSSGIAGFALGITEYISMDELIGIANGMSERVYLAEWENLNDLLRRISTEMCLLS